MHNFVRVSLWRFDVLVFHKVHFHDCVRRFEFIFRFSGGFC